MNVRHTMTALGAITILALTTACANDDPMPPPAETTSTTTAAAPKPTGIASGEPVPAKLDIVPGRIGRVDVGMSKNEALATGYFDADVKIGGDACPTIAMGVLASLTTDKGVGIGSTLGEINDAYGDDASPAEEAGYSQTGVYVTDRDKWLGFLVNESFADVTPGSKVTFIEVTKGHKPDLMRGGC